MMQLSWAWWTTIIGGFFTLGIFSYLWRENRFYRFCEHLFIGIAAGWALLARRWIRRTMSSGLKSVGCSMLPLQNSMRQSTIISVA